MNNTDKQTKIYKNWNTLNNLNYERKTSCFEDVTNTIDFDNLTLDQKTAIYNVSTRTLPKFADCFESIFPNNDTDNELIYIVSHRNRTFLVNTEGYTYCRYIVELKNY